MEGLSSWILEIIKYGKESLLKKSRILKNEICMELSFLEQQIKLMSF